MQLFESDPPPNLNVVLHSSESSLRKPFTRYLMPTMLSALQENSFLRSNFAPEKDDDANRDGEQEPRRQVHLGGPLRYSYDFDHGGRLLALR